MTSATSAREIAGHLQEICKKEKIKADDDALMLLAKAGAGSMRDALSLLDRMLSVGEKHLDMELVERLLGLPKSQRMFDLAGAIAGGDVKATLGQASSLIDSGLSVDSLLGALVDHLRNLLIIRTCGPDSELVEAPGLAMKDLTSQTERFDPIALTQDITILEELRRQIRQSQAGRALLDATLVRMALSDQFSSIGELLSRLDGGAGPGEPQKKNDRVGPAVGRAATGVAAKVPPGNARPEAASSASPFIDAAAEPLAGPLDHAGADAKAQSPLMAAGGAGTAEGASISLGAVVASGEPASGGEIPAGSEAPNVEPVDPSNLPAVWRAMLNLLAGHGHGLQSLLSPGKLASIDDGRAIVRYGSQHETFVKMLDRNGKKELVRDGLSRVLGQPVGILFEVEPETAAAAAPVSAANGGASRAAPRGLRLPWNRLRRARRAGNSGNDRASTPERSAGGGAYADAGSNGHQNRIGRAMFDAFKNLGNLPGLMAKAREVQDKMKSMQEEMGRREVTAGAGAGIVEATVNGRLELKRIRIDKTKIDPADTEMLEDLIVAAVNAAQARAGEMMKAEMQRLTGEMGLPPGMLP